MNDWIGVVLCGLVYFAAERIAGEVKKLRADVELFRNSFMETQYPTWRTGQFGASYGALSASELSAIRDKLIDLNVAAHDRQRQAELDRQETLEAITTQLREIGAEAQSSATSLATMMGDISTVAADIGESAERLRRRFPDAPEEDGWDLLYGKPRTAAP